LASNPYAGQQHQSSAPDLDASAPQLRSSDTGRTNRRAMALLAGMVAVIIVGVLLIVNALTKRHDAPAKPRDETVNVPLAPTPVPVGPAAQTPPPLPQPIALAPKPAPQLPQPVQLPAPPPEPRGPTLMERRMMAGETAPQSGSLPGAGGNPQSAQALPAIPGLRSSRPGSPDALPDVSNAQPLNNPDTLMLRGTFIRCVLQTRIVTDYPGFTSCGVTEPVYSFNGKRLLLPKGSKVLGKYEMEPTSNRVYVIWDRIVTPNGIDVNMASPGVDNLGGSGHPGYYNAHWPSRIGAALLISLLSDAFKYEAAEHGPRQTTISNGVVTQSPFESNTAQTVQNIANQAVQRAANRPATVTINQGTVVSIYVAKDVDFSGVVARF
jgi:type IV secretion system protein VirB10